jgi:GNAT superfamily N-acetyltransferase
MHPPTFTRAHATTHRDALLQLNLEYMAWTFAELEKLPGLGATPLAEMDVPAYVANTIAKVCGEAPPRGAFYLLEWEGHLVGMGGLRYVCDGVAEVKRLYVRPPWRGQQLGQAILQRVLSDAQAFGYQRIWLDSGPFMPSAHRLYAAAGFVDRAPYAQAEVPQAFHGVWRFMERAL